VIVDTRFMVLVYFVQAGDEATALFSNACWDGLSMIRSIRHVPAEIMVIHVQRWCAWVLFSVSTHLVLLCAGRLLAEGPTVLRDPDSIHVKLCALFHHSSAVMVERAHVKKTNGTVTGHKKN
jgi:hypothetical protein